MDVERVIDSDELLAENARLRAANESLQASLDELELQHQEEVRRRSEFVSMLAHEMKGPMTTISGFGKALEERWDQLSEEKRSHILRLVTGEMQRLSRLVNDMLDASRLESGVLSYDFEAVSLRDAVDALLATHDSLRANHEVRLELPSDLPPVRADRDKLCQVLLNLLTNAARYSAPGTTIRLGGTLLGDEVLASVRDEGVGIPDDKRADVFSKFVVLNTSGWAKKGTGLGLFIVKEIVEAHGGAVWCESNSPEPGTTFFFTLPVADE